LYTQQAEGAPVDGNTFVFKPYTVQQETAKSGGKLDVTALLARFFKDDEEAPAIVTTTEASITKIEQEPVPTNISAPKFSGDPYEFTEILVPYAREMWNRYGILPSLTVAQSMLESGFGERAIGWNLTGTKACCQKAAVKDVFVYYMGTEMQTAGTCTVHTNRIKSRLWTKESRNGEVVSVESWFAYYSDAEEFIQERYRILSNEDNYPDLLWEADYIAATAKVKKYATNPNYVSELRSLIESYNLTKWDGGDAQ
jgi:lysozyme